MEALCNRTELQIAARLAAEAGPAADDTAAAHGAASDGGAREKE